LAERSANPGFLVFAIIEIELEAIHARLAQVPTQPPSGENQTEGTCG
jgi:hypothetical protein